MYVSSVVYFKRQRNTDLDMVSCISRVRGLDQLKKVTIMSCANIWVFLYAVDIRAKTMNPTIYFQQTLRKFRSCIMQHSNHADHINPLV